MPSLPSSAAPTATFVPFASLRGSVGTSSPVGRNATTQSSRGHRGRRHAPPTFRYVGRLVVEKKPSGRTPSAGAGSKRASGAWDNGGASKLGGRYWNRGRLTLADSPAIAERQSYAAYPRGGRGQTSQERHRIAVHHDVSRAASQGLPRVHHAAQRLGVGRLRQHVPAPAVLESRDGTRRGAQDREGPRQLFGARPPQPRRHALGGAPRRRLLRRRGQEARQAHVGRIGRVRWGPEGELSRREL